MMSAMSSNDRSTWSNDLDELEAEAEALPPQSDAERYALGTLLGQGGDAEVRAQAMRAKVVPGLHAATSSGRSENSSGPLTPTTARRTSAPRNGSPS